MRSLEQAAPQLAAAALYYPPEMDSDSHAKGFGMTLVETEQVLVVPTSVFHHLGHFQGFSNEVSRYLDEILSPEHTSYRPRSEMEEDPSHKQLIP